VAVKLPDDLSPQDIRLWLAHGVVSREGEPAFVSGDLDDDGRMFIRKVSGESEWVHFLELDMLPTPSGFTNVGVGHNLALYVERLAKKQYTRTFRPMHCILRCMNDPKDVVRVRPALDRVMGSSMNVLFETDPDIVREFVNRVYYEMDEAVHLLESGALSVALSPAVALVKTDRYGPDEYMVAYDLVEVGRLSQRRYVPSAPELIAKRITRFFAKKGAA
jgi:hypothetical protein